MRTWLPVLAVCGLAAAGCVDDGPTSASSPHPKRTTTVPTTAPTTSSTTPAGTTTTVPTPPGGPFTIAEWYEELFSSADVSADQALGINTYVRLVGGLPLVPAGTPVIDNYTVADDPRITGWELEDEADITYRYDVQGGVDLINSQIDSKSAKTRYANFSKGVLFGPTDWLSDADAARFVNIPRLDVTAVDAYWFMDPDICQGDQGGVFVTGVNAPLPADQCRLARNYGLNVDRMRELDALDGVHKPVWVYIEVGNYESNGQPPPAPAQVRAAVWHVLIAGGEGVTYFPHHRGSVCPETYHVLRESCFAALRQTLTTMHGQIQQLADRLAMPLEAQPISGPVRARRMGDTIIAGATTAPGGTGTFNASGTTAQVLYEGRSIPIVGGQFSDSFADGNAVHIYRVS